LNLKSGREFLYVLNMIRYFKSLLFVFITLILAQFVFAQTTQQNFNRARTFDVQHYLIRTSFDRKTRTIFGDTTISLKPLKSGFNAVALDAANLNFETITLEPEAAALPFKTAEDKVFITLAKNYSPKDLIKIRLKYSAKPRKGVYFVNAESDGGTLLHETQIWTQGEAEESRYWFPSYDFPDDKATTEQFLAVEAEETAISNGELIETLQNADGTKTFHFKMTVPHSVYLTSFVIGKYVKFTDTYKNIPLAVYLYPGRDYLYERVFANTGQMMRAFEELTGIAFPFNKYDQTIVAHFNLGGMENITATTLSDRDIFFSDRNRLVVEDIISHELAHSWFGNLVTCRNWAELWLNEGFATFMEAAWREKMYGRPDYLRKIAADRDIYFAEESKMDRKHGLYNQFARPDNSIFDSVTYQKGGAVVHTLRETLGDKIFWKAINIYLSKHKLGNVETTDLQKVFEDVSKKDLDWFFNQWIYAAGYPRLEIKYRYNAETRRLNLRVNQTQKAEDSTPSAFILPLDIEITTPGGVINEKITITRRAETFAVKLNEAPTNIAFDKELKIPLMLLKVQHE
jgi:aminopeptidase N